MYGMTNSGKLFAGELTEWLIKEVFVQSQCQMSIYYKYAPDGSKIVVLSYVDDCVYWYTNEDIGKWFVDTLGKRFHVNFLGFAHWFMSIRISQLKDHSISVDQARYATSIVAKYLDTATVKVSNKFYKTKLPSDMINQVNRKSDDLISTETLHDIRDGNQTHPKIDKREAHIVIRYRI